jgi:hypothetical protein
MNKEISFFDLDGVLWNIKNDDIWIIDKEKPYKPVLILDPLEFQLIQNGKFKKDDLKDFVAVCFVAFGILVIRRAA